VTLISSFVGVVRTNAPLEWGPKIMEREELEMPDNFAVKLRNRE